jgi:hypothetical protein
MFSYSFGAFGDIVVCIQLIAQVVKALCASTGASEEYQALVMELSCLHDSLLHVQRILEQSKNSDIRSNMMLTAGLHDSFPQTDIQGFVCRCMAFIQRISAKVIGYQNRLKKGSSKHISRQCWPSVILTVLMRQKVAGGSRGRKLDGLAFISVI